MVTGLAAEIIPLAENNFGDTRTGGLSGPMGLFIIVLLAIATVLLIRNMNKRLRRLPDRFPDKGGYMTRRGETPVLDPTESDGEAAGRTDAGSAPKN